ncbi:MAG: hypothetical protein UW69_C0009G0003 [Microgenomates group bacterium GW2011_GWA2_44_7]|nr:MAG: hypothetical protein UW69_C0009G0003 [Microgenomates group bacterium GW2011_GWA2_44_7]
MVEKKIKNIHIIINPAAGKNEPVLAIINKGLKDSGIRWEILITKKAGDGLQFAKVAVKEGVDAVAAYGGDGTMMEVAGGLMGTEVPLVILPGGSANVLATELNIPKDLKEAFALIHHGPHEIKAVDMAQYNHCHFITGMVLGFGADLVKGADRESKNKFGILAYFFSAAAVLQRLKLTRYDLKIDGKEYRVKGLTCLVYNVGNLGFSKISLDKHIDISDGLLDVMILKKANLSFLKLLVTTFLTRERPENYELVEHWQGKDISLSSSRKQIVQCDGEVIEPISLHIKVIPAAIKILVPKLVPKKENKTIEK